MAIVVLSVFFMIGLVNAAEVSDPLQRYYEHINKTGDDTVKTQEGANGNAEPANVTAAKKEEIKTVSLCEGCLIGGDCIVKGVQKRESEEGLLYYCGYKNEALLAKEVGDLCLADYECISYFCKDGFCNEIVKEEKVSGILISVLVGIILIVGGGVFLLFKFGSGFKKIQKEEEKIKKAEKKDSAWKKKVAGIKQKPYSYRPEFDILEKKLKEKLKK